MAGAVDSYPEPVAYGLVVERHKLVVHVVQGTCTSSAAAVVLAESFDASSSGRRGWGLDKSFEPAAVHVADRHDWGSVNT